MAKNPPKSDDPLDGMSKEVDRLLKQLPGADPSLRGSGPVVSSSGGASLGVGSRSLGGTAMGGGPREPTGRDKLGTWLLVGLGALAGVFMTQWPYHHACGWALYGYLGAVATVILAGGWGSVTSWKHRMGTAHVVSLSVLAWGVVLAAQQVLPRIGYAAAAATWRCL